MNNYLKEKIFYHMSEFEVRPDVDRIPDGYNREDYLNLITIKFDDGVVMCSDRIVIQKRVQRDGSVKWAVVSGHGSVLSKSENWFVYEGLNSSRTDEHLEDTRFNSIEEALAAFQKLNLYKANF